MECMVAVCNCTVKYKKFLYLGARAGHSVTTRRDRVAPVFWTIKEASPKRTAPSRPWRRFRFYFGLYTGVCFCGSGFFTLSFLSLSLRISIAAS